jgi:hypothetical protein
MKAETAMPSTRNQCCTSDVSLTAAKGPASDVPEGRQGCHER